MTTTEHPAAAEPLPAGAQRRQQRAKASWQKVQLAWRAAGRSVPAIRDDLVWYANIQMDRARLRFARLRTQFALGVLALLAVATLFAIAAWLLIAGLAGGAGELFGGNVWLGQAATGAATLLLLAAVLGGGLWLQGRGRLRRLVRRHARLAGEVVVPTGAGRGPC